MYNLLNMISVNGVVDGETVVFEVNVSKGVGMGFFAVVL